MSHDQHFKDLILDYPRAAQDASKIDPERDRDFTRSPAF
jgi:hypothetical protein